jgi:hypothetical protein
VIKSDLELIYIFSSLFDVHFSQEMSDCENLRLFILVGLKSASLALVVVRAPQIFQSDSTICEASARP